MAINLKEILISDVDNIKLDKVNYNFDQLVANGGGPQGYQGPNGALGYQGVTGYQGYQGELGYQGDQGPQGNNGQGIWKINPGVVGSSTTDTILPIHDEAVNTETPSVIIGYKSADPEYDDEYIESDSQLVIHRHDNFASNLTLKSSEVEDSSFVFTLRSGDTVGSAVVDMKFDGAGLGSLNQYADIFTWNYGTNNAPLITLDNTVLDVSVDSEFKDVSITGSLKIQPDVDVNGNNIDVTDHIAVSGDSDGTVVFKSIADIGGVVPIGTMVSMIPSQFADSTKFINEQLNVTSPTNHPLHIEIGKGINAHTGWYLCNGKTWTNGTDLFPTPDLNSFSYIIDNDPNTSTSDSQGEVPLVSNTEISIIGGADTEMSADYNNATSQFDITGSVTAGITSFQSQSGATYTIKRLPQIIFFGEPDLYWTDAGTNAEDTLPSMSFGDWWDQSGMNAQVTANANGTITLSKGNNTNSIYYPVTASAASETISANTNAGTRSITDIVVSMVVPAGHGNTGETLKRTFTRTQPTSYTAPVTNTGVTWSITNNITGTDLEIYKQYNSPIATSKYTSTSNSYAQAFLYLKPAFGYDLVESSNWSASSSTTSSGSGSIGASVASSNTTPTVSSVEEYRAITVSASGLNGGSVTGNVTLTGSARLKNTWTLKETTTNSLETAVRTANDGYSIGDEITLTGSSHSDKCYEIMGMLYQQVPPSNNISGSCIPPAAVTPPPATVPQGSFMRFGSNVSQGTETSGTSITVDISSNVDWRIEKTSGSAISSNNSGDGPTYQTSTNMTAGSSGSTQFSLIAVTNDGYNGDVMDTFTLYTEATAVTGNFKNASNNQVTTFESIQANGNAFMYVESSVAYTLVLSEAGKISIDSNGGSATSEDEFEISAGSTSGVVSIYLRDASSGANIATLAINVVGTPVLTYEDGTIPANTSTNLPITFEKDPGSTYNVGNFTLTAGAGKRFTQTPTITLPSGLENTFTAGAVTDSDGNHISHYFHITHTNTPSTSQQYAITFSASTEDIPRAAELRYEVGSIPAFTSTNLPITFEKDPGTTYNVGNFEIYAAAGKRFTQTPTITLPSGLTRTFTAGPQNDSDGNHIGHYFHVTHTNTPATDQQYAITFGANTEDIPSGPTSMSLKEMGSEVTSIRLLEYGDSDDGEARTITASLNPSTYVAGSSSYPVSVASKPSWVNIMVFGANIEISANSTNYGSSRSGTITISTGGFSKSISVTQEAAFCPSYPHECNGFNCLVEGTMILLSDGSEIAIEELSVGDKLYSVDIDGLALEQTREEEFAWSSSGLKTTPNETTIVHIQPTEVEEVISINDGLLEATWYHLQMVERDNVWKIMEFREIKVNDKFIDVNGNLVNVDKIENINKEVTVYKLDVEDRDVYYANNILTHNK